MNTFVQRRSINTARRLIDKYGGDATLIQFVTEVPVNLDKAWTIVNSNQIEQRVKAVFVSAHRTKYGLSTEAQLSDNVAHEEQKVLLAAKGVSPSPTLSGQIIAADGTRWTIASIEVVAPDREHYVLFSLQVRQ